MELASFGSSWDGLGRVVISTVTVFFVIIGYTRLSGLRSFAKMSSFDFATTVAVGSLIASTAASSSVTLLDGVVAVGILYLCQFVVALVRRRTEFEKVIDNTPKALMVGDRFIQHHLSQTRVTEADIWAKLREHGVLDLSELHCVVLETTGTISVLHGDALPDPRLLAGVDGTDDVRTQR